VEAQPCMHFKNKYIYTCHPSASEVHFCEVASEVHFNEPHVCVCACLCVCVYVCVCVCVCVFVCSGH